MGFRVVYVDRVVRDVSYQDVTCDRCGKTPPSQSMITGDRGLQYDNVLILNLSGGYGMFIDPDPSMIRSEAYNPETTKIFCHECAHEFATWFGWDVRNTHTHVPAELGGTQHPDHHTA